MKVDMILSIALAMCLVNTLPIYSKEYDMDTNYDEINVSPPPSQFSSGTLKSHSIFYYTTNRNKTLILSAPTGYGMLAAFQLIDLRASKQDTIVLFDKNQPTRRKTYVNDYYSIHNREEFPDEDNIFYAPSGQLGVNFITGSSYPYPSGYEGFKLIFTVQGTRSSDCGSSAFWCDNFRCISDKFRCDGHNNCGDRSDENNCDTYSTSFPTSYPTYPSDYSSSSTGRNIGIVFGVTFFGIVVCYGIYFVIGRSNPTRTEIRTLHPPPAYPPPADPPPAYPPTGPGMYYPPPPPYSTTQGMDNPGFR